MKMLKTVVKNKQGLHARPAAMLAVKAGQFKSSIMIANASRSVNAKSIMGVMLLAASCGTVLNIEIDGEDEVSAHDLIASLFNESFGERD